MDLHHGSFIYAIVLDKILSTCFPKQTLLIMADTKDDTQTWPELAIGLYDKLTGRGAEISYEFDDFELEVPSRVGESAEYAKWKMNGTLRIRTRDDA